MFSIKPLIIFALFCLTFINKIESKTYDDVEYDLSTALLTTWEVGKTLTFTLPHNVDVIGTITSLQTFADNHYFITGDVPDDGWFQASYYQDTLNANIAYPGNLQYELRPTVVNKSVMNSKKTYKMRDVDINTEYFAKDADADNADAADVFGNETTVTFSKPLVSAITSKGMSSAMMKQDVKLTAITQLKLLILYTKDAVLASGSETNLLATITLAVGNFNAALKNSLIDVSVSHVAQRLVEYDTYVEGTDTFQTQLSNLGNGVFNTRARYAVGAHAVQLIVKNAAYCGLGNYNFNGQTSGLTVACYTCIGGYLSLAHEVAHNIGLHHDIQTYTGVGPNHGSCWDDATSTTTCKRSVLAYAGCKTSTGRTNCDRVQYFSNPNVAIGGKTIGDATNSNNAQQFISNIQTFTNLYTMQPAIVPTAAPSSAPVPAPSKLPYSTPIITPTVSPVASVPTFSMAPTMTPTEVPTRKPSGTPVTFAPSIAQTFTPSSKPVYTPTKTPVVATNQPFKKGTKPPPTFKPTIAVYDGFSAEPTISNEPSYEPSVGPSEPTISPANSTDLTNTAGAATDKMTVVYSVVFVLISLFIITAIFCAWYFYHKPSANDDDDDDINDHSIAPYNNDDNEEGGSGSGGFKSKTAAAPATRYSNDEPSVSARGIYTGTAQTAFSIQQDENMQNRLRKNSESVARASAAARQSQRAIGQNISNVNVIVEEEGDEEDDDDDMMGERLDSTRLLPTDIHTSTGSGVVGSSGRVASFRSNKNNTSSNNNSNNNISSKIGVAITSVVDNIGSSSSSAKPEDQGYKNI